MQAQDGVQARKTGRYQFRAAGEAREKMRLHKTGRDPDIGLYPVASQPYRNLVAVHALPGKRITVPRVMVDHPDRADDLLTEELHQLGLGAPTVSAGRDDDRDVIEIDEAVEFRQQHRDHQPARLWPGNVTGGDRHRLARTDTIPQRCTGHRSPERTAQSGGRIGRLRPVQDRLHDGAAAASTSMSKTPSP